MEIKKRIEKINRGEVPEGYKKTRLGIIPEDWEVKSLGETRDVDDKYSFTGGPFGSDLKKVHYTNNGVRILQLQNIGDGVFLDDYKIYTSSRKADELCSCNIFPGEVLIAKMAEPLARACIVPDKEDRYLMASDGIRLKIDSNKYVTKYIMEYINSNNFRNKAIKKGTGTTRLRIGLGELARIKLAIPKISEQQKIAQILSTWDKAIELKEKLIEGKKEQKKGLMQKLLTGEVRLAGFDEEATKARLKGYIKEIKRKNTKEKTSKILSVTNTKGFIEQHEQFDKRVASKDLSNYKIIKKGEFAYNPSRINVGSIDWLRSYEAGVLSPMYVVFKTEDDKLLPEYIYQYVKSDEFYEKIKGLLEGSVRSSLSFKALEMIKLFIPKSLQEQKAIAQILSTADKEIDLLNQELEELKLQKKGLVQLLLTGIVRVKY